MDPHKTKEPRLEDLSLLLGHTCDPQTCMSEAHPTTLTAQPTPLQGHTYDPETPHVRSPPTTLTAPPTTLQGHTYDPQTRMSGARLRPSQLHLRPFKVTPTTPQTCMSGSHDDPFRTLAEYKGIPQSASKEEGSNTDPSEKLF